MSEQGSNVVSLNTTSSSVLQFEIETLFHNLLTQYIVPQLPSATNAVADSISKKLQSAASNADLMYFMEVEQKFNRSKDQLIDGFSEALFNRISPWMEDNNADPEITTETLHEDCLSLIDNSILEHRLAWQAAARQMSMSGQLQNLYNCESRLEDFNSTESELIPIGPLAICECFASVLSPLNFNLETTEELLLQFALQLKSFSAKMWQEADHRLNAMGLELKAPKASTYSDPQEKNKMPESTAKIESTDSQLIDNIARQVVTRVEALLGQQFTGSSSEASLTASSAPPSSFAAGDLASTLTSIQCELNEQNSTISNLYDVIKNALLNKGVTQSLSPRQEDLINMVGLLFEYIIDDHELPDEIKKLIGLLQIPVLKLALIEKEFLTEREHSGRQLLNDMTSAGRHCKDSDDPILHLIEKTVKTIIRNFTDNPHIFTDCLNEFASSLLLIESHTVQAVEEDYQDAAPPDQNLETETLATNSGSDKISDTFECPVDQVISACQSRHHIPDALIELVSDGWKEVLLFSLEQNRSDEHWYHRVNTLDMLLWNLQKEHQDKVNTDDWPTFKNYVIDQLNEVEFNQFVVAEWLHAINSMINNGTDFEEEIIIQSQSEPESVDNTSIQIGKGRKNEDTMNTSLDPSTPLTSTSEPATEMPEIGQWVEFIGKNDHRLRCRLATIHYSNRYIFVNKSGMKVAEWSGTELEKAIKNQKVEILDNHQFFDRALQAVMGNFLKF